MSPVSSSKACAPAAARVQVPFTLSDTWTSPGTLYWENHPTSRSPPATGRVSVTVAVGTREPVANAAPWTNAGVVAWARAGGQGGHPEWQSRHGEHRSGWKAKIAW